MLAAQSIGALRLVWEYEIHGDHIFRDCSGGSDEIANKFSFTMIPFSGERTLEKLNVGDFYEWAIVWWH